MTVAASGKRVRFVHVALAFVLAFASIMALRTWALPQMQQLTADQAYFKTCDAPCLFDARPRGYTVEEAKAYLDALGPDARAYYADWYIPVYDVALPVTLLAFGIVYCRWMTQLERRFAVHLTPFWRVAILAIPFALFGFDIAENLSVLSMLKTYPQQGRQLVEFASFFSQAKWIAAYLSVGLGASLLLFGAIGWLRRR